jgi:hypothetical protein
MAMKVKRTNVAVAYSFHFVYSIPLGNGIKSLKGTLKQREDLVRFPHGTPSGEARDIRDCKKRGRNA